MMKLDFLVKIYKWLGNLIEPIRTWLFENHNNPFLWIGLNVGIILIFSVVYRSLWGKDSKK